MAPPDGTSTVVFAEPAEFRRWLRSHHASEKEITVGFWKKGTGRPSLTWPESVDEALCYGWIDGIRRSIDAESYTIRFTPRKPDSHWSNINIRRVAQLRRLGLMRPAGENAFALRTETRSRRASYEQRTVALDETFLRQFRRNTRAWGFFSAQAPSYRKQCVWWVMSAKKEETRMRRLTVLIRSSSKREPIPPMRWAVNRSIPPEKQKPRRKPTPGL